MPLRRSGGLSGSMSDALAPCIYVLAGTNGAGKTSLLGTVLEQREVEFYNPDAAARELRAAHPRLDQEEANEKAWLMGKNLLERAITERRDFAFETTLGGKTITALLNRALETGLEVRVWYMGLKNPELHLARVRARVLSGGHDISERRIRQRYVSSRANLVRLLPRLTELNVYDNSFDADPLTGQTPQPRLILRMDQGRIISRCEDSALPEWAKPIMGQALSVGRLDA